MQLSNHGHLAQQLLLILCKDLFTLLFLWLVGGGGGEGGRRVKRESPTIRDRPSVKKRTDTNLVLIIKETDWV